MGFRRSGPSLAALALLAAGGPVRAQEAEIEPPRSDPPPESGEVAASGERRIYTPEDFTRFAPHTALDMLEEVPGFTIVAEDDARGLGQASGNILINGERFSSKTISAAGQLGRIPAKDVIRIEIVDGASLDIPGLSGQVANVIALTVELSGQFEWRSQFATGPAAFRWSQGDASLSGVAGPVTYTIALANPAFYGGSGGPNRITDALGEAELRYSENRSSLDVPELSGSFAIDLPGSALANLNLAYGRDILRLREHEHRTDPALPALEEAIRRKRDGYSYEIGGDIAFALGPGRLRLIALEDYEDDDSASQAVLAIDDGSAPTGTRFLLSSRATERIARAEYGWRMLGGDWQLSGEGAFNELDTVAALYRLDEGGAFVEVPFPAATGGVREDRYEALLSYSRPLTGKLSLQATFGGEYSRIAQTGTNALARTFERPKGSLSLAWTPRRGLDVSLEVARRVGQLDFFDFLAAVDLEDDNTDAGNNQLRPEQSWETRLQVSRDFGAWGSTTLTLFHDRITDYLTVIPIADGESPGNVDNATRTGFVLDGTLRFDPVGFAGARLNVELRYENSRLEDPVTGVKRAFDRTTPRNFEADFRHDVPSTQWAWGGEFRVTEFAPYYRVTEVGLDHNPDLFAGLFVEHKDVLGMTVRARAANLFHKELVLRRTIYDGPRDDAPVLFTEERLREIGYIFNLTVSGSF